MLELYLRRSMILSSGDPTVFLRQPISAGLLLVAAALLAIVCIPFITRKREEIFIEDS
jgi:TctA family transporter